MYDVKAPYDLVYFDIVGYCNAKCPYCMTGSRRVDDAAFPSKAIEVDRFEKAIDHLLANGFICAGRSRIDLYSWGEPLLHPKLNDVLRVLSTRNIDFGLSTNASKAVQLDSDVLTNLRELKFSISGFSQSSYDRIHGFEFETIRKNMETLVKNVRGAGSPSEFTMAFHIYQFNVGEMRSAAEFCRRNGIGFGPYCARLADYEFKKWYLEGAISREMLDRMSKDLFLDYIDGLMAAMPEDYKCPQLSKLTIDEYCNALTCCILAKDHPEYSLGSLFDLSKSEIHDMRLARKVCGECIKSGVAYWTHNTLTPRFADDYRYLMRVQQMSEKRELDRQKRDGQVQEHDKRIDAILNSWSYRLGRTLTWPIRYVMDRLM